MLELAVPRRARTIALLILALVTAALFAGGVGPAYAASGISGTVMGDGDPVPGTTVTVYDASGGVAATQVTNGDGSFGIVLPSGSYRLLLEPPGGSGLRAEYWDDQQTLAAATVISVGSSVVQNIFVLERGATISGRLETGGAGVAGAVQAFDADGRLVAAATTVDGDYTIGALFGGEYRIKATPAAATAAYQWYGQTYSFDLATEVVVPTAGTVTGIDIDADTNAALYGTVTSSDGLPMAGVKVVVFAATGSSPRAVTFVLADASAADGGFYLGPLPLGEYRVGFTTDPGGVSASYDLLPSSGGYVSQWAEKKYTWATATVTGISAGLSIPLTGISGGGPIVLENPRFGDVGDPSSTFYPFIEWMAAEGISTGTAQPSGKPLYKPVDSVTRQAMALFLYRMSGETLTPPAEATFADVPSGGQFFEAIEWMALRNISTGTPQPSGKPLYKPSDPVSRQAMALFLSRYASATLPTPTEQSFADVPVAATTAAAIEWMKSTGISTGTPQPSGLPLYKPLDPVSRQAMSAFLYRLDHLIP